MANICHRENLGVKLFSLAFIYLFCFGFTKIWIFCFRKVYFLANPDFFVQDKRYSDADLSAHDGQSIAAIKAETLSHLISKADDFDGN